MGKTSPVWEIFNEGVNKRYVECKLCGEKFNCGQDGAGAGNTCMIRHAKNKHQEEYFKAQQKVTQKNGQKGN